MGIMLILNKEYEDQESAALANKKKPATKINLQAGDF
jgi:hypothetical protein